MRGKTLKELVYDYVRMVVAQTLARNGGDKGATARALGLTRRAFDKLLDRYRMSKPRFARPLPIVRVVGRVDDEREG